jgi:hypothetical protein
LKPTLLTSPAVGRLNKVNKILGRVGQNVLLRFVEVGISSLRPGYRQGIVKLFADGLAGCPRLLTKENNSHISKWSAGCGIAIKDDILLTAAIICASSIPCNTTNRNFMVTTMTGMNISIVSSVRILF